MVESYLHEVRSVFVYERAERQSVSERRGHVGHGDIPVSADLDLTPLLERFHGRHDRRRETRTFTQKQTEECVSVTGWCQSRTADERDQAPPRTDGGERRKKERKKERKPQSFPESASRAVYPEHGNGFQFQRNWKKGSLT